LARDQSTEAEIRQTRRLLAAVLGLALIAVFVVWRIDSPRVERLRMAVIDRIVPDLGWALVPVARLSTMVADVTTYARVYEQNRELRRELQQMKAWREAAIQLEQENAHLLDLNRVRLDPSLMHVTGVVLADSGSPFRQSVLINVGQRDGIRDGWATMDGLGLVGRVAGLGERTARVLLLTDAASRVPVTVLPSGQRAMLAGDNSTLPPLDFVETPDLVRPGDRVVSSGEGGVFPAGLPVGEVVEGPDGRLRVTLAADYLRLEFLRVLRSHEAPVISDPGGLIVPQTPPILPETSDGAPMPAEAPPAEAPGNG